MKQIAMLLYPGFTPLDAIGPYHALSQFPGYEFFYVAQSAGPISDGGATIIEAQKSISEVSEVDILVVPGGLPAITMARAGDPLIDWIAKIHPTTEWTISVCTGALMLGAAGVLNGIPATTLLGALLGCPALKGGFGSYSISNCIFSAKALPKIRSANTNDISIPADTPAAVITFPDSTTRSSFAIAP